MTEVTADAMRQASIAVVEQAQDYEMPPIMRLIIRIKNGVPGIRAGALYRRELALARAKACHNGRA